MKSQSATLLVIKTVPTPLFLQLISFTSKVVCSSHNICVDFRWPDRPRPPLQQPVQGPGRDPGAGGRPPGGAGGGRPVGDPDGRHLGPLARPLDGRTRHPTGKQHIR